MKKIMFSILLVVILVIVAFDYFSPLALADSASCQSGPCSCTCSGPDNCICTSGNDRCSCYCPNGGGSNCGNEKMEQRE